MTTSGTVTFSVQRDQIITDAMFDAGALGVGEAINDNDLQFCARRLNMLVKQWQGRQDFAPGLKMWSRKRGNLFLSGSSGQYTVGPGGTGWATSFTQIATTAASASGASTITVSSISGLSSGDNIGIVLDSQAIQWTTINGAPSGSTVTLTATLTGHVASGNTVYTYPTTSQARRPLEIVTVSIRDQFQNDVPIYKMTLQEYEALPTKAQTTSPTDPTSIYYEAQLTNGILYTDAPAAADCNKYLHIVYLSPIEDFNAATDTPDYPQEWYLALVAGLAINIAPAFQLPVTQDMKSNFVAALSIAQQSNAENTALFFQRGEEFYAPWANF
jgi:hypothetical protein